MKSVFVCLILIVEMCLGQISYPESISENNSNAAGRLPLYSPTRCKQNELLFPGDQLNDWICDCAPANIYYPDTDACYPAFRQGPCDTGYVLVLLREQIIPKCVNNSCKVDGQVPIRTQCYELNTPGPCKNAYFTFVLAVNPKTLQLDCVKLWMGLENRFGAADLDKPTMNYDLSEIEMCARGTKRAIEGRCTEI